MKVNTLTVSQLISFVESDQYQKLDIKPITPERARSQALNPSASPDDVVLIFIAKDYQLLTFIGLLPFESHGEKFFANSCWWASDKGKSLSMSLFYTAYKVTKNRFVVFDGSMLTKPILQATNLFHFVENELAFRGFSRFYLGQLSSKRDPNKTIRNTFFQFLDWNLNLLWNVVVRSQVKKRFRFEAIVPDDVRLNALIIQNRSMSFMDRNALDFVWMIDQSWLTSEIEKDLIYPFSHCVNLFQLQWFLIWEKSQLIGAILESQRNGHLRIPYFFSNSGHSASDIGKAVEQLIRKENYLSVTIFNSEISSELMKAKRLFYLKKRFERVTCFSKEMKLHFDHHPHIHDGDGDSVFTG